MLQQSGDLFLFPDLRPFFKVRNRELTMAGVAKQKVFCRAAIAALFAAGLTLAAAPAVAQDHQGNAQPAGAAPPPVASPSQAPAPPQAANRPGFLHQLKVWWDESTGRFDRNGRDGRRGSGDAARNPDDGGDAADTVKAAGKNAAAATQDAMKSAVEATKGAASTATDAMKSAIEATKNAATTIVRLPGTRVVEVRETCARAPNGASDCATAAADGCRTKGFNGGTPLDVRTAETCDTRPAQPGQVPGVRCGRETVVIRAVCQ